ncbi:hypothetical protein B0T25DRAFT_597064, partial [Lasiosphaeria hispida]
MMPFNMILTKKVLGNILTPSGRSLVLSIATKTTNWDRPDFIADTMKVPLEKAVAANESILPGDAAEIILRYEGDHTSPADTMLHITAVCVGSNGDIIRTVHLPTAK